MKVKLGPKAAAMATAHKIAVVSYTMVKNQVEYDETIWDAPRRPERKEHPSQTTRLGSQNENGMVATPDHMRDRSGASPIHLRANQELHCPPQAAFCRALPRFSGNEACESFPSSELPAN